MRNPYDVLGIPQGSDMSRVNVAYRQLAAQYENNPAALAELNAAYDAIVMGNPVYNDSQDYTDIINKINQNRLEDAQILLDGIPYGARTAQWHYLKGLIAQKKGWLEQAANYFETAHLMEPSNPEYANAYAWVQQQQSGGYRVQQEKKSSSDCSFYDMCAGLLCADCCCECMGGDLIDCC